MIRAQTTTSKTAPESTASGLAKLPSRLVTSTLDEREAEMLDPYAMGWDAGEDLDDPPACPFNDGIKAQLWRKGFSARVQKYIAGTLRTGGLQAALS